MSRNIGIVFRWWWLLLLYVIAGAVVCFFVYTKTPPQFVSTTKIFVTSSSSAALANVYDAPYTDRAVKTVSILAAGDEVVHTIASKLQLDDAAVKKSIKVKSIDGTQVIGIDVKNEDRETVDTIAAIMPRVLEEKIDQIQGNNNEMASDQIAADKNQLKISVAEQSLSPRIDRMNSIKFIVIIAIFWTLFGYGMFYFLCYFDRSISSAEEFERVSLKYLGGLGHIDNVNSGIGMLLDKEGNNHLSLETIREVRSNIFIDRDSSHTITVTSLRPKEGKSIFTASLALALAEIGKRVVLVDADLRSPSVGKLFNIKTAVGLADYLERKIPCEELVFKTGHNNLGVILAGNDASAKTSSLMKTDKLELLISWLKDVGKIDFILFDTPPVEACSDAAFLAKVSDGIIFTSRSGKTSHRDLLKIKKVAKKIHTKLLGVVLTKTKKYNRYRYY